MALRSSCPIVWLFSLATAGLAQPTISYVQNAASNTPQQNVPIPRVVVPLLPNAGIAQGAMFVIKGDKLGPASIVIAGSYPLQTSLAGTSVEVTVGGKTLSALMYYAQSHQIAAILPSTTPVGAGFVSVAYNGGTNGAPILVVQNNVAMYTISQNGAGDAVATLADYSLVLPNNAPNPGDVVTFWANGLGPVQSDETRPGPAGDMTSVPLEVSIGGKPATVLYRARNPCCVSEDQINVKGPDGVSGCAVSVTMKIGNVVSNTTTIPIASTGRVCTPTKTAISQTDVQRLLGKRSINVGTVYLTRSLAVSSLTNPKLVTDSGGATFLNSSAPPSVVLDSLSEIPSYGSCTTFIAASPLLGFTEQDLDAGASIGVSGPNGNLVLAKLSFTNPSVVYGTPFDQAPFLDPGSYTITGTGGPDTGGFHVDIVVPPPLVWTNYQQIAGIDRTKGVTVTWTGGDPAGYVTVSGMSTMDHPGGTYYNSAEFSCYARVSDGSFTVPPFVLLALPASAQGPNPSGSGLEVAGTSTPVQFQASGLDLGLASSTVRYTLSLLPYQ